MDGVEKKEAFGIQKL